MELNVTPTPAPTTRTDYRAGWLDDRDGSWHPFTRFDAQPTFEAAEADLAEARRYYAPGVARVASAVARALAANRLEVRMQTITRTPWTAVR